MDTKTYKFSASSIKEFEQCGLKFKLGRIDRLEKDPESTHHRWMGKVVHASIYSAIGKFKLEEGFKSWEVTGEFNPENSRKFFEAAWEGTADEYLAAVIQFEAGDRPPSERFLKGKIKALEHIDHDTRMYAWKEVAWGMVESGLQIISKLPEIVEIEKKIEFEYLERKFVGFVDVLAKGSDGKYIFLDFKTSWVKPNADKLDQDLQFIMYSYFLKDILDVDYNPIGYYVHLRSTSVVLFEMLPHIEELMNNTISKVFNRLEKDLYFSTKGGPLCSYCDFYSHCYGGIKQWH